MHYAVEDKSITPWVVKTTLGYLAGGLAWAVLTVITRYLKNNDALLVWLVQLVSMGIAGMITGLFQGQHIHAIDARISIRSWAIFTAAGMILGLTVVGVFSFFFGTWAVNFPVTGAGLTPSLNNGSMTNSSLSLSISASWLFLYFGAIFAFTYGAVDGLTVGILQWLAIKRYLRESYWWTLVNMVAIAAAGVIVLLVSWVGGLAAGGADVIQEAGIRAATVGLFVWGAMGFVLSVLSAPILNWLLRQPIEEGRLL